LIRMPTNRAGKLVRCPECKTVIRIADISETERLSGKPIPIRAIAMRTSNPSDLPTELVEPNQYIPEPAGTSELLTAIPAKLPDNDVEIQRPKNIPPNSTRSAKLRLPLPRFVAPTKQDVDTGKSTGIQGPLTEVLVQRSGQDRSARISAIVSRAQRAELERRHLIRFFGFCLIGVALFNSIPAIYQWSLWSEEMAFRPLPRWTYLQIFIAGLHVVYAIYLLQIAHWTSMKAVAIVLLAVAIVFGVVSTGLVVGGGNGVIARFLNLPQIGIRNACLWCLAMLFLATLTSYVIGREARNWQRVDELLRSIYAADKGP
jgi:hypothetical protein